MVQINAAVTLSSQGRWSVRGVAKSQWRSDWPQVRNKAINRDGQMGSIVEMLFNNLDERATDDNAIHSRTHHRRNVLLRVNTESNEHRFAGTIPDESNRVQCDFVERYRRTRYAIFRYRVHKPSAIGQSRIHRFNRRSCINRHDGR